ncbi:hypothetical protein CEXT_406191 [Caerostris extrusa]|uniref:Uncharacterized protein n=1 Tax=Caerostris extrusa TaxID=172846 RepID=A0AAV4MGK7_CAEEX|nr:hypothetical protein CEXT_406191 [Caerostris extrusa]
MEVEKFGVNGWPHLAVPSSPLAAKATARIKAVHRKASLELKPRVKPSGVAHHFRGVSRGQKCRQVRIADLDPWWLRWEVVAVSGFGLTALYQRMIKGWNAAMKKPHVDAFRRNKRQSQNIKHLMKILMKHCQEQVSQHQSTT